MTAEPKANPLVLSASSINQYLRCGLAWYLGYVLGIKAPPSGRQVLGIAGHRAVELDMTQKVDTHEDLPLDDVLDAFSDSFDEQAPEIEDERPGPLKDSGVAAVRTYYKRAAPLVQPIEVEKPVQFALNGTPISGQVDVIDEAGRIRDTKFVGRTPSPGKYALNMTLYAIAYRQGASTQNVAVIERDTVLDVIVRKARPEYVPVSAGGPISEQQIRSVATIVENVRDGITKGNFPANGLATEGTCRTCNFQKVCPAYNGVRR